MNSQSIVTADLHGSTIYQAGITIDALLRRSGGVYRIRLIHGCHGGAAMRDFIAETYGRHPKVKRLVRSPDGGTTELVLREYS